MRSLHASFSKDTFDCAAKLIFSAVLKIVSEIQKANSRCGKQLSEAIVQFSQRHTLFTVCWNVRAFSILIGSEGPREILHVK